MGKRKIFILVSGAIVLAVGGGLLLRPDPTQNNGTSQAVLSGATQRFETELQECLAYNQNLYDHDRQKIERANISATSNPKEVRLKTLEEWYQFEQQACRDFHESRLETLGVQ